MVQRKWAENADGDQLRKEIKKYIPSTFPGSRAPHVFLKDRKVSLLDTYGPQFSLIAFAKGAEKPAAELFMQVAKERGMELKTVVLRYENHARMIWRSNLVLVRADGPVAWRGGQAPDRETVKDILDVVNGQKIFPEYVAAKPRVINIDGISGPSKNFTETELLALGEKV